MAKSEVGPQPRTAQQSVKELEHRQWATIPGPYVLVSEHWRFDVVRLFAHDYPTDVAAGVVLVEPMNPGTVVHSPRIMTPTRSQFKGQSSILRSGAFRSRVCRARAALGLIPHFTAGGRGKPISFLSVRPLYFQSLLECETRAIPESMYAGIVQTLAMCPFNRLRPAAPVGMHKYPLAEAG